MNLQEGQVFKAIFITRGRNTGKPHAVELRAVYYNKMIYFSRRNPNSDWLKNAIASPDVRLEYNNESYVGKASLVIDEDLAKRISCLKYSDKRSEESRVVLQVRLYE
ncbi:MAG: hypothetical protein ACRD90_01055 [Nitrosopumilaceae archaeon]